MQKNIKFNIPGWFILLFILTGLCLPSPSFACTIWAASGDSADGKGTIIVKNRDWAPDHQQELKLVTPKKGNRYYGLFAVGGKSPGLKAGINEYGLVLVNASASSIPSRQRPKGKSKMKLFNYILENCKNVDDVIRKKKYFYYPQYLLLADKKKVAIIEIASNNRISIKQTSNGVLYHTNHYLDKDLLGFNKKVTKSSDIRFKRIEQLLSGQNPPYTMDDFIKFSQDKNDGPDNSIWRTGSKPSITRTMATWIVVQPVNGESILYVRLANPSMKEKVYKLSVKAIMY